eukprot:1161311-Pelagomonas_calceolata.AAC.9
MSHSYLKKLVSKEKQGISKKDRYTNGAVHAPGRPQVVPGKSRTPHTSKQPQKKIRGEWGEARERGMSELLKGHRSLGWLTASSSIGSRHPQALADCIPKH